MVNSAGKIILILDLDGVLITTPPWKPDLIHEDGYSDFNQAAVDNLNRLLAQAEFEIWLSSSRRTNKSLADFNAIFKNRGVAGEICGYLPQYAERHDRVTEVNRFLDANAKADFIILDDDNSLNDLPSLRKRFWIKTDSLLGFDTIKLEEAISKIQGGTV